MCVLSSCSFVCLIIVANITKKASGYLRKIYIYFAVLILCIYCIYLVWLAVYVLCIFYAFYIHIDFYNCYSFNYYRFEIIGTGGSVFFTLICFVLCSFICVYFTLIDVYL